MAKEYGQSLIIYEPGPVDEYHGEAAFITKDEKTLTMAKLMAKEVYWDGKDAFHPCMRYPGFPDMECDEMLIMSNLEQVKSLAESAGEEIIYIDYEGETA